MSMHRTLQRFTLSITLALGLLLPHGSLRAQEKNDDLIKSSVRDLTTVLVVGAGGAVLGLSTLSFVETPKDHLKNILIGGALGVIVGVGVVAYNQANASRHHLEAQALREDSSEFGTSARGRWHTENVEKYVQHNPPPQFLYQFRF